MAFRQLHDTISEVTDEIVTPKERGKLQHSYLLDLACLPKNDCQGAQENWEKVVIYRNAGPEGIRYETIHWNRDECGAKIRQPFEKK
jgi:hypothetical protein